MRKHLQSTHNSELQMLEETYINEINNHTKTWNTKFNEFDEKADRQQEQLLERQEIEIRNCIEYFETAYPNMKFSSKLLDLRMKEANLVKAERYVFFNKIYRSPSNSTRS
jgi:hypothetical protein